MLRIDIPEIRVAAPNTAPRLLTPRLGVELDAGGVFVINGPSGSGKTLALKYIAGQTPDIDGQTHIVYENCNVSLQPDGPEDGTPSDRRRVVQYVPHDLLHFFLCADVASEVELGLEISGGGAGQLPDDRRRLLFQLGINNVTFSAMNAISCGERQLVALASALARAPRVLILDEPFRVLSGGSLEKAIECVVSASRKGMIVVLATHDFDSTARLKSEVNATVHVIGDLHPCQNMDATHDQQHVTSTSAGTTRTGEQVCEIPGGDLMVHDDGRFLFSYEETRIAAGDCILLEGQVGCGKTTFIELLTGANGTWPKGSSYYGTEAQNRPPAYPDDVGYVGASPMTQAFSGRVRDYLEFAPQRSGKMAATVSTGLDLLVRLLERLNISPNSFVTDLSFGQQKAVAMARYANVPGFLAIDEVPLSCDRNQQNVITDILAFYLDQGSSLLLTSHHPGPLRPLCNRRFLVKDGWLHQE